MWKQLSDRNKGDRGLKKENQHKIKSVTETEYPEEARTLTSQQLQVEGRCGRGESFDTKTRPRAVAVLQDSVSLYFPTPTPFSCTELEMKARALHILGKYCVVE